MNEILDTHKDYIYYYIEIDGRDDLSKVVKE